MACPETCSFNEIRQPLTTEECETLTSGVGIDGITDVCDYLQSLPARLFSIQQYLQDAGNYGALPVNEESKCKPGDAPTASSLTSEIARAINGIVCYLCGVSGNVTHFHSEPGDFNQSATEPVNTPDPLKAGDTVIEDFDDYIVFWTYDGVNWVKNFTHDKSDANTTFETYNQTIPTPSYTTPQTTPADPEAGDTLVEQFLDGIVYWTYDGTNWVKNFTDSKDIHSYHILQAGSAGSLTPAFPVPITTAQAGDTAIVKWDDGEAKYTFDGTNWNLDWFEPISNGLTCDVYPNDPNSCATTTETITTLVQNLDGTATYTSEDATQTIFATAPLGIQAFDTTSFTADIDNGVSVPANATRAKVRVWGAGGASGGSLGISTSGAGGAGGYVEALINVTAGDTIQVNLGSGGPQVVDGSNGTAGNQSRVYKTGSFDLIADGGGGGIITDFIANGASFNGAGGAGGSGSIADATDVVNSFILDGETGEKGGFLWYNAGGGDGVNSAFLPFGDATELSNDITALTPPLDTDGLDYQYNYMKEVFKPKGGVPAFHPGEWGRGGHGSVAAFWSETWDNNAGTDGYVIIEWY
jgi:hypothetical protein